MEPTVTDVPEDSRYEIRDGDRVLGLAAYQRRGDQVDEIEGGLFYRPGRGHVVTR